MNENIKIYKTSDYDWIASPLDTEKTVEWYRKEFGEDTIELIDEVKEYKTSEFEFWNEVDTNTPLTEFIPDERPRVGAVKLKYGIKWQLITAEMYMEKMKTEIKEPFIISSTEYFT
jgi:hypothetical protein